MYFLLTPEYDTWSCFKGSFPECGELSHLGLLLGRVSAFPTTLVFLHPAADVEKAKRAEGNYHCSKTQSSSATHHICPEAIGEGGSRGHMCEQNDKHRLWVGWVGSLGHVLTPHQGRRNVHFWWKALPQGASSPTIMPSHWALYWVPVEGDKEHKSVSIDSAPHASWDHFLSITYWATGWLQSLFSTASSQLYSYLTLRPISPNVSSEKFLLR